MTSDGRILSVVRRLAARCLLVLLVVLPGIDSAYCPDGCTDATRSAGGSNTEARPASDSCGLCLNGVAVHCDVAVVEPVERFTNVAPRVTFALISIPPPSLDRPPRRFV